MRSTLSKTKFGDAPIVSVSATDPEIGTEELKSALLQKVEGMKFSRDVSSPFLMAIDHCFAIKGQGTVLTGTVLQGVVKVNDVS
jgi:selenocysteine-specific elongation factor